MNKNIVSRVHWSFWVITSLMLVWNVMGCINFLLQMNPEMVASYRESEQAIISGRPGWATAAFALAVFGGALGCLLLMLKRSVAFYFFIASLVGVVVTMIHALGTGIDFGIGEIVGIIIMPVGIAVFLIGYSTYVDRKGWLSHRA